MSLQPINHHKRSEQAFDSQLRTVAIIDLASLVGTDGFEGSIDRQLEDLMEDMLETAYPVHPSMELMRKVVMDADQDEIEFLGEYMEPHGLLGFAVKFSNPEMTKQGHGGLRWTWGITQSTWVYADSYEEAWALGVEWAAARKAEALAQPTPKGGSGGKKQRGYYSFDLGGFLAVVMVIGIVIGLALAYGAPWLWDFVKPWLHALTA